MLRRRHRERRFPFLSPGGGNLFTKRHFYFGAVFQTRLKCVGVGGGGIAVYGTAWPQDRPTDDDDHNYQIFESERVKNDAGIDSLSRFVKGKKIFATDFI